MRGRRRPIPGVAAAAAAAALLALSCGAVALSTRSPAEVAVEATSGRPAEIAGPTDGLARSDASAAPSGEGDPREPTAPVIPASAPTRLFLPETDRGPGVDVGLLRLTCGSDIPYPTSGPDRWKAFYCADYALPSTSMPHYGIITGHSTQTASIDTVMNRLLLQDDLIGREIYVQTESSGSTWLVFQFIDLEHIDKSDLVHARAWGDPSTSTEGHLVFLACAQERFGGEGTDNVLFTAQFVAVVDSVPT